MMIIMMIIIIIMLIAELMIVVCRAGDPSRCSLVSGRLLHIYIYIYVNVDMYSLEGSRAPLERLRPDQYELIQLTCHNAKE